MEAPMKEDDISVQKAVSFINKEFGDDVSALHKAKQLLEDVLVTRSKIEEKLSFASSTVPNKIDTAIHNAQTTTQKIKSLAKTQAQLGGDIRNLMVNVGPEVKNLSQLTDQIDELQRYSAYLKWIAKIEDLSSDIQSALIINAEDKAVSHFEELVSVSKQLQGSECKHLAKFATETVLFWYSILKDRFSKEFSEILKVWGWPFIVTTTRARPTSPNKDVSVQKEKLAPVFNLMLRLQLPDELSTTPAQPSHPVLADLPGWRPLLLPIHHMLKPLAKRFRFHFYGNKQTNSIDKPEWYMTHTLTWIKDHKQFLRNKIQPLLNKHGLKYIDAVLELSRGLILLVMEKMLADLPEVMYDDQHFSHLVDETLAFDKELKELLPSGTPPSCLYVLSLDEPFEKWLTIERKFAFEKMDGMLSSPTAWHCQYKDVPEVDELRVPECGEAFITLMLTMTERYRPLPQRTKQLAFLGLQLELCEDFRARLAQVKSAVVESPLGSSYAAILNTASYVLDVLNEWKEMPFYLQLQYYRSYHNREDENLSKNESETRLNTLEASVFDGMILLLQHMRKEMLRGSIMWVVDDVKARSRPYRKDRWLALPAQKDAGLALSASACDMLVVLKDHLHLLQSLLSASLFSTLWQKVAEKLNTFFYNEVILANNFNEGGGQQLHFDMTRNLFPLFGQYTAKPENYFKDVKESCVLLTLRAGSALLLKDVLYRALHDPDADPTGSKASDPVAALHDVGVHKLSLEQAEIVISLRSDLVN